MIRPAGDADASAIRDVLTASFATPVEADLVERLASDGDLVLSFVAVREGAVVGHIGFSRMSVTAEGEPVSALGLAPLAVLPSHRRHGIGGRLVERGLAAANGRGTALVFVLGEPDFYGGFGFRPATAAPFASPYAGPHFMAQWLSSPRVPAWGAAEYAPAFATL